MKNEKSEKLDGKVARFFCWVLCVEDVGELGADYIILSRPDFQNLHNLAAIQ